MGRKREVVALVKPTLKQIVTDRKYRVAKCCLSCQHYAPGEDLGGNIYCCRTEEYESRYNLCKGYELHSRYDKIGIIQGEVKPIGYYQWRLMLVAKFTFHDTNWSAYKEFVRPMGDLYEYWKNNVKDNANYEL